MMIESPIGPIIMSECGFEVKDGKSRLVRFGGSIDVPEDEHPKNCAHIEYKMRDGKIVATYRPIVEYLTEWKDMGCDL